VSSVRDRTARLPRDDRLGKPDEQSAVFSKWYGESEEIIRKVFEHAAKQERAIISFDEIDSVAGQRAEESHEASHRIVAQLLTSVDGFTADNNVMVSAATNQPQDIDALRRPGRAKAWWRSRIGGEPGGRFELLFTPVRRRCSTKFGRFLGAVGHLVP
jgi:SpoVK/Ycf46/Vps4 family AAA+-type ATPase